MFSVKFSVKVKEASSKVSSSRYTLKVASSAVVGKLVMFNSKCATILAVGSHLKKMYIVLL